jgi:hypothetical protein
MFSSPSFAGHHLSPSVSSWNYFIDPSYYTCYALLLLGYRSQNLAVELLASNVEYGNHAINLNVTADDIRIRTNVLLAPNAGPS